MTILFSFNIKVEAFYFFLQLNKPSILKEKKQIFVHLFLIKEQIKKQLGHS